MSVTVLGGVILGISGRIVAVEVNMRGGLPGLEVIGLAGRTVRESAHRVRSALAAVGYRLPPRKFVVNLTPADMPKRGSSLDLPIAVGLLRATGQPGPHDDHWFAGTGFWGQVGLDGSLLPSPGALAFALAAEQRGLERIVVAPGDAPFAALGGIAVLTLESVTQFVRCGPRPWDRRAGRLPAGTDGLVLESDGMRAGRADPASRAAYLAIAGLAGPRRAVHLAAAGGHSCCFLGPPGVGKSMLARSLHALLQQPAESELVQIVAIATAGSLSAEGQGGDLEQLGDRPLREPMAGVSLGAMVGTGKPFCAGEVTRAHGGVLLLDELGRFRAEVLSAICTAMDRRWVEVRTEHGPVRLPAGFQLAATSNLCPCGRLGGPAGGCVCTPAARRAFWRRLSGSVLDRVDMHVEVSGPELYELEQRFVGRSATHAGSVPAGSFTEEQRALAELAAHRASVAEVRAVQAARYGGQATNATAPDGLVLDRAMMSQDALRLLAQAHQELALSARGYFSVVRVGRTIADVAGHEAIEADDLAEAVAYRARGAGGGAG